MILGSRYRNDGVAILKLNDVQREYIGRVKKKLLEGGYTYEIVPCAVCNKEEFEPVSHKDRYGFELTVVACRHCGLVQTNPRMDQASYNQFYDQEYRYVYGGEEGPTEYFFNDQYFRLGKKIFDFIQKVLVNQSIQGKFVVEVGCGAGGILKYFKDRGCVVKGIDLGSEYINYGQEKHDLDLMVGDIKSLNLNKQPDIIIYSHVLEHILDLKSQLKQISSMMHNDTVLYIEVPGLKNLQHSYEGDLLLYLQNAHVYHFTKVSLLNLMQSNGFEVISINECIRSLFKKSHSINVIKSVNSEYPAIVHYLKKIERMRRIFPIPLYVIKFRLKRGIYNVLRFFRLVSPLKN